ncbi:unnamed protein product [Cladocopium goreaui]|uniref:Uncharacterized protein n=1 Tax=Cladocopium goreaui TaxID=2562237 RepID=A0A9P1CTL8_9DINO|nr:unnamed protein product [Cladocopium goreaui]
MPSASAISAIRAIAIAVLFLEVEASRSFETETASELFDALENRSHQSHAGELGEPVDLDGTVAKKGWECGKPADDVPNRELVKNAKKKAQYLIYNWLKKSVCPPSLGEKEQHWVARPPSVLDQKRGKPCKSSITGQEDSIGCMKFHWDLDVGECGSKLVSQVQSPEEKKLNIKAMQDRFTVKGGTATVLCSDLMSESVRKTYPLDHFSGDTIWG